MNKMILPLWIIIICLVSNYNLYCQDIEYDFKYFTEEYIPLDSTISTTAFYNKSWDDVVPIEYFIFASIGFNFEIAGKKFDSIAIDYSGILEFYTNCGLDEGEDKEYSYAPSLYAFHADMDDLNELWDDIDEIPPGSRIHYLTEGEVGNRIFKIEWHKAGFWASVSDEEYISFQVWLHEASQIIEFRYGEKYIEDTADAAKWFVVDGPIIGINYSTDCTDYFTLEDLENKFVLTTDYTNPIIKTVSSFSDLYAQTLPPMVLPANRAVYQFEPSIVAIEETLDSSPIKVYPTIVEKSLKIETSLNFLNKNSLSIYNCLGQRILQKPLVTKNAEIDVSNFPEGYYILSVENINEKHTFSFIKK
ncbi:MAG: T9SS type A sorting domain-containing protein [Chitinophagales bacterium]